MITPANAMLFVIFALSEEGCLQISQREEWGARAPKSTPEKLNLPVPIVVLHHSHMTPCNTSEDCITSMKAIQDFHLDKREWDDIGYNFLIGGFGQIYEGRGWNMKGAHAGPDYNNRSMGICLIGDFTNFLPLRVQLDATKELIQFGMNNNYIMGNYTLYGHRDVRPTDCPGEVLYKEIETWPHKNLPSLCSP